MTHVESLYDFGSIFQNSRRGPCAVGCNYRLHHMSSRPWRVCLVSSNIEDQKFRSIFYLWYLILLNMRLRCCYTNWQFVCIIWFLRMGNLDARNWFAMVWRFGLGDQACHLAIQFCMFLSLDLCLQLLDLPGIIEGAKDGKGRGRQVEILNHLQNSPLLLPMSIIRVIT